MKDWMKDHDTAVRLIALVLSPIILPLVAIYWVAGSMIEVIDDFIEVVEAWWNEP